MSDSLHFGDPAALPTRAEFETLLERQNNVAVRCMAMENVLRGLGAWIAAALPDASADRFLDSLSVTEDLLLDPAMPPVQADRLRALVAREQRHIVDLIRQQNQRRASTPPDPEPRAEP